MDSVQQIPQALIVLSAIINVAYCFCNICLNDTYINYFQLLAFTFHASLQCIGFRFSIEVGFLYAVYLWSGWIVWWREGKK